MPLFAEFDLYGLAAVMTAIAALIGAVYGVRGHAAAVAVRSEVAAVKDDMHEVKVATDGMKTALVESTERAAAAEGELKGRADQKADDADAKP